MQYSSSVLWLLIFFVLIAVCIFASLIYYAERMTTRNPDENMFGSIPDALWFNMITMSTIGYGDLYPKTMLGMIIGGVSTGNLCTTRESNLSARFLLVAGVLIIDLPMPIIVETFANFYTHLRARSKLPKTRRKIGPAESTIKKRNPMGGFDNGQSLKLLGQTTRTSLFTNKTLNNNNILSSVAWNVNRRLIFVVGFSFCCQPCFGGKRINWSRVLHPLRAEYPISLAEVDVKCFQLIDALLVRLIVVLCRSANRLAWESTW